MADGMATLMIDVAGLSLDDEDRLLLASPQVAGIILFKRNVDTPEQVRALTDAMRAINNQLIISVDQEGGRVARLRTGFSPLPAMGQLGRLYDTVGAQVAAALAYDCGYLMACEVLAVGIDISFAPVLDIDAGSIVIGDRAFHQSPKTAAVLAAQFMAGMHAAGMATTGKHFPGHGSVIPDSHIADACDTRSLDAIWSCDMQVFIDNLAQLDALMPAHVVFAQVDDKPAGFSKIWLTDILRARLGYDGVIFSDDLSMKAAQVAGDVAARVAAAINAGCDVALVCNDRSGAKAAIAAAANLPKPKVNRFLRMKAKIPAWQGSLEATCVAAFGEWQATRTRVQSAFFNDCVAATPTSDPTQYNH